MVTYEVTVTVEPALVERFETYMCRTHVPEIMATGCFRAIRFERAGDGVFRTAYAAASRADVDRYLREHTAHFRADFARHFPAGVSADRRVWETLQEWS